MTLQRNIKTMNITCVRYSQS